MVSHLIERSAKKLYKMEDIKEQKRKFSHSVDCFPDHLCLGEGWSSIMQSNSLGLIRKFQIELLKVMFLRDLETAVKSWFADVGLSTSVSILGLLFLG